MASLFDPIVIRGTEIPNRIVMPPMTTRLAAPDGSVTPELIQYFVTRAEGGAGLVTVEMCSPEPAGRHRARELGIAEERFVPGLLELTSRLRAAGSRTAVQIGHAGGHTREDVTGHPPVAPSALPHVVQEVDTRRVMPQELTREGIQALVQAFADATERARRAGFDAVEVHGAHGYLIAQFLSPLDNRRGDEYGGSLQNRARFALEVVDACRRRVGDFPLIFRFSADEFAPGGFVPEEAERLACWLVEAGIDVLHVSAGCYRSLPSGAVMIPPMRYPGGVFLHLARAIKAVVPVPVIAVGRLHDPETAARAVREGHADMVALGRQLIADPEWPRKVREGRTDEIRPCIACNTCVDGMREGDQITCLVNPWAGREGQRRRPAVDRARRMLVAGGGPAGMEAARLLAERGHRVVLVERGQALGGQLALAVKAPLFQNVETSAPVVRTFVEFLARQLERTGVDVRRGTTVTPELLDALKPETVVLATGASYRIPFRWFIPRLLASRWARSRAAMALLRRPWVRWLLFSVIRRRNDGLERSVRRAGIPVQRIGDCRQTRKTLDAMRDAAELGDRL